MSSNQQMGAIGWANRRATLDAVYQLGERCSLADLVAMTGLSRPTLTAALKRFEQAGLLRSEAIRSTSGVGRPLIQYTPIADHHRFVAIEIGYSDFEVGIADVFGRWIDYERGPIVGATYPPAVAAALTRVLDRGQGPVSAGALAVMGITRNGAVLKSHRHPELEEPETIETILRPLSARWPEAEVSVHNDAKLAAAWLVEVAAERGVTASSAVALHMSQAAGCGVVIDGQVLEGAHGAAGEVGLAEASPFHLAERTIAAATSALGITWRDLFSTASQGPEQIRAAQKLGRYLGQGISPVIVALDPEVVLVGGPVGDGGSEVGTALAEVLAEISLTPPTVQVLDQTSDAVMQGALHTSIRTARDLLVNRLD